MKTRFWCVISRNGKVIVVYQDEQQLATSSSSLEKQKALLGDGIGCKRCFKEQYFVVFCIKEKDKLITGLYVVSRLRNM
jgi:hypothetical protein